MQFAVVEYSSKSGKIWRHQPGRPNYLEDPEKVIDPTSFGSYVSALSGEHIPLTALIKPTKAKKAYKRLTGSWPAYSLEYLRKFDALLVVHQISDAHEIASFTKRLKRLFPQVLIFGVPTQPYGLLRPHLESHPKEQKTFQELIDTCNCFLTVVNATRGWYASLSSTPVEYIPQIYPAHFAMQFAKRPSQKKSAIFVAGITDRPAITQGLTIAREVQKRLPDVAIQVTQIPGVPMDLTNLKGAQYDIIPFKKWREHLPELASFKLVINTDYTFTRGRVPVDCAAVGTACLGGNSDGQIDLFPELTSTPKTSNEKLIAQAQRILSDEKHSTTLIERASARLTSYDFEPSRQRILQLIEKYRSIAVDK